MYEMNLITDIFDIIRFALPFFMSYVVRYPKEDYYYSIVYVDELL
jgi:hypothetical protein